MPLSNAARLALLTLPLLAACGGPAPQAAAPVARQGAAPPPVRWSCQGGPQRLQSTFVTQPAPAVVLTAPGTPAVTLPQVVSGSGARFASGDGSREFWTRGSEAMLTLPGSGQTSCALSR